MILRLLIANWGLLWREDITRPCLTHLKMGVRWRGSGLFLGNYGLLLMKTEEVRVNPKTTEGSVRADGDIDVEGS